METAATTASANVTDAMHFLAQTLIKNDLDTIYGLIGIPVTDVARVAQGEGIRYIGCRHEANAGNAAAAAGFITGKPGLYITVSAPGFLNGIVPLKEATENGWPVIMMSGSSNRQLVDMGEGDYEGLDQYNFAKPFCKAAYRIDKIEDIPLGIARAIRAAVSGRPGGVYVDLPADMLMQTIDVDQARALLYKVNDPAPAQYPAQSAIDQAMELLASAKKPLVYLGKGAALAHADAEVQTFVKSLGCPFLPMSMAKGLIPDDDPQCAGSARGFTLRQADVVVLIGARLNWMMGFGTSKEWNPDVKFIQLDIDPVEIDNSRYIAAPVVGDIKSALTMMNEYLAKHPVKADPAWLESIQADAKKNDEKFAAKIASSAVPMNHFNALGAIKKVTDAHPEIYITNEGANALDDCRDIIAMRLPRHRLDCGTWGVMGVAVPYAIAAAVTGNGQVISISGDSAFGFDNNDLETACRYNLPITFVVLNNGGIYRGDFENLDKNSTDPSPLTLDSSAHYEKLIEAYGGTGYYATTPEEVTAMLTEAVESKKPCCIHVQLDKGSGTESGHISYLNPIPVVGPLADSEMTEEPYPHK